MMGQRSAVDRVSYEELYPRAEGIVRFQFRSQPVRLACYGLLSSDILSLVFQKIWPLIFYRRVLFMMHVFNIQLRVWVFKQNSLLFCCLLERRRKVLYIEVKHFCYSILPKTVSFFISGVALHILAFFRDIGRQVYFSLQPIFQGKN